MGGGMPKVNRSVAGTVSAFGDPLIPVKPVATLSINGGPDVPLPLVKEALKVIRGAKARAKALDTGNAQRDIEQDTGVAAAQADRETQVGGIVAERLRSIIERTERIEEERKALASDIKDIMAEAKSAGFDVRVVRQILRIRKQEPADVEEQEALLDLYRRALGM
jgi:uncharacterized protein (UPF0335 family)